MSDYLNTNYGCHEYFKDSAYKRFHRYHQDNSYLLFNYSLGGDSCCGGCCGGGGLFGGGWGGILGLLGGGLAIGGLFGLGKLIFGGGARREEKPEKPEKDNTDIGGQSKGIAELQAKIKEQQEKIAALQAENDSQDSAISDLTTRVASLESSGLGAAPPNEVVEEDDFDTQLEDADINGLIELLKTDGLTEDQINAIVGKFKTLLASNTPEEKLDLAKNENLDPRLLAVVRESYYETGYKNASFADLTKSGAAVQRAHDHSGNTEDVENTKGATISSDGKTIIINDKYNDDDSKTFKATYVFVKESTTGELIFQSSRNKQLYIAQIGTNGKIHLMQYAYHTGFMDADVTAENYTDETV